MSVLTKIFIVLVALLSVLLVPLVVVYAYNENSYRQMFLDQDAARARAEGDLAVAQSALERLRGQKAEEIARLEAANRDLRGQTNQQESEVRALEGRLATAQRNNAEIDAKLATLASAVDAGQQLTRTVIEELREIRQRALDAERRKVELDEALRDALAQLDVAVEARRALEEQLQRLKDEHATTLDKLGGYIARFGAMDDETPLAGALVDRRLEATVINVRRSSGTDLAEIDAGSRDGVEEGWVLTIGRGADFVARIRIEKVDINSSTGVIELEDRTGLEVMVGDTAYARPVR